MNPRDVSGVEGTVSPPRDVSGLQGAVSCPKDVAGLQARCHSPQHGVTLRPSSTSVSRITAVVRVRQQLQSEAKPSSANETSVSIVAIVLQMPSYHCALIRH